MSTPAEPTPAEMDELMGYVRRLGRLDAVEGLVTSTGRTWLAGAAAITALASLFTPGWVWPYAIGMVAAWLALLVCNALVYRHRRGRARRQP